MLHSPLWHDECIGYIYYRGTLGYGYILTVLRDSSLHGVDFFFNL